MGATFPAPEGALMPGGYLAENLNLRFRRHLTCGPK
jgi:hypothetical protein